MILARTEPANAQTQVKMEILFENGLNQISKTTCNNFNATIKVTLPAGVAIDFCDVELHWDPAKLELLTGTSVDVVEGPWMKSYGSTVFAVQPPQTAAGILPDIACGYLAGGPALGSGIFCTVMFHCKATGDSNIVLWKPTNAADAETYLLMLGALVSIDVAQNGRVIPEFPVSMLLPFFLILTAFAAIATTVWSRKRQISIKIP